VDRLFLPSEFVEFGPNYLDPSAPATTLQHVSGSRGSALRGSIRVACSRKPGIYGMLDEHGELLYIGKAKSLRARLLSYFRPHSRDPKAGRILTHTRAIVWEVSPCEFGALHRELELIRRWRPRFNVQGQPQGRQFTYVCMGHGPAPYVFVARRPPRNLLAAYGPVSAGARTTDAVRRINDWFQLRDCPRAQEMVFADQGPLFPVVSGAGCLRHEIGTCLGPCAGACSQRAYTARVRQARAFLTGTDLQPLHSLKKAMNSAADAQDFERAATCRDRLQSLQGLHDQLTRMCQIQAEGALVYPVQCHDGSSLWYLIRGGRTVAAIQAPSCPASSKRAATRIEEVFGLNIPGGGSTSFEHLDDVFLVASWFRRHPGERARALQPAEAMKTAKKTGASHARSP